MEDPGASVLRRFLARVVPGSGLRDGIERVLHARMGALIVFGDHPAVLAICSGGFHLDAEMTPQRLYELAKMDGAIILNEAGSRIAWANVHLVPNSATPTTETGTRHRTAERVARSIGVVVVAVSEETGMITLYQDDERFALESSDVLLTRASHLLASLERFKERYEEALARLETSVEMSGVSPEDVVGALQRGDAVSRVATELRLVLDELGEQGRVFSLHFDDLVRDVPRDSLVALGEEIAPSPNAVRARVEKMGTDELISVAKRLLG